MKREIVHRNCEPGFSYHIIDGYKFAFRAEPYPGEHVRLYRGIAKRQFICDNCGETIEEGKDCTAVSIWADYGGIPYYPWESEYVGEIL